MQRRTKKISNDLCMDMSDIVVQSQGRSLSTYILDGSARARLVLKLHAHGRLE